MEDLDPPEVTALNDCRVRVLRWCRPRHAYGY